MGQAASVAGQNMITFGSVTQDWTTTTIVVHRSEPADRDSLKWAALVMFKMKNALRNSGRVNKNFR